jgi:hypothetical protein
LNQAARVVGWGRTSQTWAFSDTLKYTDAQFLDTATCQVSYGITIYSTRLFIADDSDLKVLPNGSWPNYGPTNWNLWKIELVSLCGFSRVWWKMKNCILSLALSGQVFWLPQFLIFWLWGAS